MVVGLDVRAGVLGLWNTLTTPRVIPRDPVRLRKARLLGNACLVLLFAFLVLHGGFMLMEPGFTTAPIHLIGFAALTGAIVANRYGWYALAATATVLMIPTVAWFRVLSGQTPDPAVTLCYMPMSLVFASLLLSLRVTFVIALVQALAAASMPLFNPAGFPMDGQYVDVVVLNAIAGALILIAIHQRDRMELDRQTERTRAEEENRRLSEAVHQKEKMQAIGELAGGIAHDINNQLTGVVGSADLLRAHLQGDPASVRLCENILRSTQRSADLIRQLLSFARKGKVATAPVELHDLIGEVVSLLERSIDKRISIRQTLLASRTVVRGDATQLQSALLNLALNARDAMPDGGTLTFRTENATLDASYRDSLSPGDYLRLTVEDTGMGMDAAVQKRIFEPFFTTKERGKGTGLGLAAVWGAIQSHKGLIEVESQLQRGSRFTILLPLSDEASPRRQESDQPPSPQSCGGRAVLLVDDEEDVRSTAVQIIQRLGHCVTPFGSGAEALVYFRAHWQRVDLVILDMIMPEMSGKETFAALQAIHPAVKVLLASGYSMDDEIRQLIGRGAKGYIQKPFTIREMGKIITEIACKG